MPHVILEYSANILDDADFPHMFARLHQLLVEQGKCRLDDIKSRAIGCEHYRVGDGDERNAFAHLTLCLLEGRDADALQALGEACLELMQTFYANSLAEQRCDLTVEIRPMRRDSYFKVSSHPGRSSSAL
jgi:5-carboxymethyl-2-hydroxymuconate isomerase